MREKLGKHVADFFWLYILVAFAVVLLWTSVYENIGKLKDNQYVAVGVYNLDFDAEGFRADVFAALPERTEQDISVVYADTVSMDFTNTQATTRLAVQLQSCDFLILPQSSLEQITVSDYFPEFPASLLSAEDSQYTVEGVCYGVQVTGEGTQSVFSRYCDTEEPCYLLLSESSVNLDGVFGRGNAGDDAALAAIRYILERDLP